jgi:RNA polymerase subunit RPABC4/transcription elongation factor Spt4
MRRRAARQLPPNAIVCPECGSPDTARYKWPDDPQSKIFSMNHPDTRVCVDCRYVWWVT